MALITFMSDFGEEDHYVAAVKARMLKINPSLQIIDISHHINPFDIAHGAFVLKSIFNDFPEGTVHLVAVNCVSKADERYIILELKDHYFVGPDNGILSLICEEEPSLIAEIMHNDLKTTVSPARDILSRAAAMLASGSDINEIGNICDDYFRLLGRQLKATKKQIAGNVVQVDHFGNLITNIEQDIFVMLHKERPFHIKFGKEVLRKIHRTYASVEPGECFVVFNSLGLLEIGINKGNASELLGLGYDSPVFINFEQDT